MSDKLRPQVGISPCLLGEEVRFDGGHKRHRFIAERLSDYFDWVTSCPEVAIGLGVPRSPIQLVGDPQRPQVLGVRDASRDVTEPLEQYSSERAEKLSGLSGYLFKKDSPSCGVRSVKVYRHHGKQPIRQGQGVFARIMTQRYPLLPVEDEGRMSDERLRENFVNRVYVYQRWQKLVAEGLTAAKLIEFHSNHKYLLMAHSQAAYKRLGRLLSDLPKQQLTPIGEAYIAELMTALKRTVTPAGHVNVLQHILGYLKQRISADDKLEMIAVIEAYRRGESPLVVPITLFKHYFRLHPDPYIERQVYLQPHPEALGLRNAL